MSIFSIRSLIATTAISSILFAPASLADCNGASALCDRSYSNVSFIGTHDSAFVGALPTENQNLDVEAQLDAGIRFLQAQSHKTDNEIHLCHTSCVELDAGTLQSYLGTVKTWLNGNANEVVTFLLTNGDSLDISEFDTVFKAAGIDSYAFVPSSSPLPIGSWPTLQDMIDSGKRFVVFLGMHNLLSQLFNLLILIHPRLRRRRLFRRLHPRRIRILFRNPLRRDRLLFQQLQHRPTLRRLRRRPHVYCQPLSRHGHSRCIHSGSRRCLNHKCRDWGRQHWGTG